MFGYTSERGRLPGEWRLKQRTGPMLIEALRRSLDTELGEYPPLQYNIFWYKVGNLLKFYNVWSCISKLHDVENCISKLYDVWNCNIKIINHRVHEFRHNSCTIQHSPSFNICAMLWNQHLFKIQVTSVYCFPYQCCVNNHCVVFGWGTGVGLDISPS